MKTNTAGSIKTKRLGNSALFNTTVGFGAWAIGEAGWEFAWGEQDDWDSKGVGKSSRR